MVTSFSEFFLLSRWGFIGPKKNPLVTILFRCQSASLSVILLAPPPDWAASFPLHRVRGGHSPDVTMRTTRGQYWLLVHSPYSSRWWGCLRMTSSLRVLHRGGVLFGGSLSDCPASLSTLDWLCLSTLNPVGVLPWTFRPSFHSGCPHSL